MASYDLPSRGFRWIDGRKDRVREEEVIIKKPKGPLPGVVSLSPILETMEKVHSQKSLSMDDSQAGRGKGVGNIGGQQVGEALTSFGPLLGMNFSSTSVVSSSILEGSMNFTHDLDVM